ncbi:MarR family winged helix-turn-helix transcriptional regulator [Microtetraspora malaysiensis]|uniref:MarR family winged helix-turn-helix transcriptional regulator n=1 Tax=Microtetraspora malaysiensis TaxID=161358 RepID=UPI003D8A655A
MDKPIGYWLKRVDRLIEGDFQRVLAGEGVRRRHWQALNVLKENPVNEEELAEALRPFWAEGEISVGEVLADLRRHGWVTPEAPYALTEEGKAARERLALAVHAARARILRGVGDEQYRTVVETLQTMAANLEPAGR